MIQKSRTQDGTQGKITSRLEGRAIKVIGLGGVGAPIAQALAQFLASHGGPSQLWLIDGDTYEERNRERVLFEAFENKAIVKGRELTSAVNGRVSILPVPRYVTPGNARRLITERDIVFLCVDNHSTRRSISNRCRKLGNVILFSGGNDGIEDGQEGTFGNVQVYLREAGRDLSSPLTRFHPEIAHPPDKRPDQIGCVDLVANAAPQLLFTNLAVASAMLGAFYAWLSGRLEYEEVYLDIAEGRMNPVRRH